MSNLYLRPVRWSEMDLLYEWANEKTVRDNSFHTEPISYDQHVNWFKHCMTDKDISIYILCKSQLKLGQIRVDCSNAEAKISYSISSSYRNLGYGKILIQLIEKQILADRSNIRCIKALVKKCNITSQKIFRFNKYEEIYNNDEKYFLFLKIITRSEEVKLPI